MGSSHSEPDSIFARARFASGLRNDEEVRPVDLIDAMGDFAVRGAVISPVNSAFRSISIWALSKSGFVAALVGLWPIKIRL